MNPVINIGNACPFRQALLFCCQTACMQADGNRISGKIGQAGYWRLEICLDCGLYDLAAYSEQSNWDAFADAKECSSAARARLLVVLSRY